MLHFPSNIKKIRGLHGTNQTDFAKIMGVSLNMQKSYETGRAEPDIVYYSRLAKLSRVDAEIIATKQVDIADMHVVRASVEKDEKVLRETIGNEIADIYSTYDPLTRTEISEMIHTNRLQAEAILNLSRNISSHGAGKVSQPLQPKSKVKRDPVRKEEFLGKSKTRLKVVPDQQKDSVKSEGK